MEHGGFTAVETAAFLQLCRLVVIDFLPYIQKVLSVLYQENTVQQLASCTLASRQTGRTEELSSLLLHITSFDSHQRLSIKVGISVAQLAEPLREVAPEVFEELEKERVRRSLEQFQQLPAQGTEEVDEEEEEEEGGGGGGGESKLSQNPAFVQDEQEGLVVSQPSPGSGKQEQADAQSLDSPTSSALPTPPSPPAAPSTGTARYVDSPQLLTWWGFGGGGGDCI